MVTGSRAWTDCALLERRLLTAVPPGTHTLVHGGARGADMIAASLAIDLGWAEEIFPADWQHCDLTCPPDDDHLEYTWRGTTYCPLAGHRRNQAMVDSRPDLVLAFPLPGSRGTWDAVRRAKKAGIPVEVVSPLAVSPELRAQASRALSVNTPPKDIKAWARQLALDVCEEVD